MLGYVVHSVGIPFGYLDLPSSRNDGAYPKTMDMQSILLGTLEVQLSPTGYFGGLALGGQAKELLSS